MQKIKLKIRFKTELCGNPIFAGTYDSMIFAAMALEAFRPFAETFYMAFENQDGTRTVYRDDEIWPILYRFERENPFTFLFIHEVKQLADNDRERALQAVELADPQPRGNKQRSTPKVAKPTTEHPIQGAMF